MKCGGKADGRVCVGGGEMQRGKSGRRHVVVRRGDVPGHVGGFPFCPSVHNAISTPSSDDRVDMLRN